MTRPPLIRQDTIDLQDQDNPSAQSHPQKATLTSQGFGLSQASALKHVAEEQYEERFQRSPRVSADWSDVFGASPDGRPVSNGSNGFTNGSSDGMYNESRDGLHDHESAEGSMHHDTGVYDHEQLTEDDTDTDGDEIGDEELDKISDIPSFTEEDIDDSLVYALHTFVATVEGQANASKGDHMVLLDDTNSYWWLVKLVKDESIGYLPAEHIETPFERLARLNKHRNGTTTGSMLGDLEPGARSKNLLKNVMRRRNAKGVTWGLQPTFVEPPENAYSNDEDSEAEESLEGTQARQIITSSQIAQDQDEITAVEPLRVKPSLGDDDRHMNGGPSWPQDAESPESHRDSVSPDREPGRQSGKRTDSFLKDESLETRKISLTPNILREDSDNSTLKSIDSKEATPRQLKPKGSLETLEKSRASTISVDSKESKEKKKDKKPRMLGLFKRRERKSKTGEKDDLTDFLNPEKLNQSSTREDDESIKDGLTSPPQSPVAASPSSSIAAAMAERRPSKLQKKTPASKVAASAAAAAAAQRDSTTPSVASSQTDAVTTSAKPAGTETAASAIAETGGSAQRGLGEQADIITSAPSRVLTAREALIAEARQVQQQQQQQHQQQPRVQRQEPHPLQESLGRNSPLDEIANMRNSPLLGRGREDWGAAAAEEKPSEDRIESSPEPDLTTAPQSRDQDRPMQSQPYQSKEPSFIVTSPSSPATGFIHQSAPTREPPISPIPRDALSPSLELAQFRQHSRQRSRDIDSVSLSSTEQVPNKSSNRPATPPSPVSPQSSTPSDDDDAPVEIRETYEPDFVAQRNMHGEHAQVSSNRYQSTGEAGSLVSTESSSLMEQNSKDIQTPSTVNTTATWSDAGLREWFEGDRGMQEVRDLLIIVGDVNGVEPVDDNHPGVRGMYDEETETLDGMNQKLDNMLDSFLKRKGLTKNQTAPAGKQASPGVI